MAHMLDLPLLDGLHLGHLWALLAPSLPLRLQERRQMQWRRQNVRARYSVLGIRAHGRCNPVRDWHPQVLFELCGGLEGRSFWCFDGAEVH